MLRKIATPENLLVFDEALPSASKKELTRVACGKRVSAVLACPRTWVPLERVLVVDQAGSLNEPFLRNAMTLCGHLRAVPIVLTLAHSERAAILRREAICAALKDWGVEARLDFIVGARIGSAVTSVVRWRRCQLILTQAPARASWWHWRRQGKPWWPTSVPDSLGFLSLADTPAATDAPPDRQQAAPRTLDADVKSFLWV